MVWSDNQDGENDFCNRRVLEYVGIPSEKAAEFDWKSNLHPDDAARVERQWQLAMETGEMYEVEKRVLGADGTYRWFQSRAIPMRDERGEIVRWYGSDADIEDLKRAEAALAEHARQLRQVDRSGSAAHVYLGRRCQRFLRKPRHRRVLRSYPT